MTIEHAQIIVNSLLKFSELLKYYGKGDIVPLSTIKLIYKLLDNINLDISFENRRILQEMAVVIQASNPSVCTLSTYSNKLTSSGDIIATSNRPPTVSDSSAAYDANTYTFKLADFTFNFVDLDGDSYQTVRILTIPVNGTLKYNGVDVTVGFEFNISNVGSLVYEQTPGSTIDTLNFRISDNNINKLFSNMATFTLNIEQIINQPPDAVGVKTIVSPSGNTTVFTVANFTTETTPAYSDPDGDAAEFIKITTLPSIGELQLNGVPLILNQSISIANIAAGKFTHVADASIKTTYNDIINFSISDVGSHQFTSGGVMTMNVQAYVNQPPSIVGNGELTIDEGLVITFTRLDFTTNTVPPYQDPEGDIADKLKITVLPTTGDLKLNGVIVLLNDVINFSDIDLSLLTFVQDAGTGGTSPVFSFQIADAGSGIFVG